MLAVHHFDAWGDVLVVLGFACGLNLLIRWYWREAMRLRRLHRRAKRIRAWRERMAAVAERPFDLRMLTAGERQRLLNAAGQTSGEWLRSCIDDFKAGRRDDGPTCAEYLAAFGERPKVRVTQR